MFDDDVEISKDFFETAFNRIEKGVVAISSMYEEQNLHMRAFLNFFYSFKKQPEQTRTANVNAMLIKRSIFEDYNPPLIFHCEDNFLYNHATKKGEWVHFIGGAKHFLIFRNSNYMAGFNTRRYGLATRSSLFKNVLYRFIIPVLAMSESHSWKTVFYFWRWNVQFIAGYLGV